MSLIIFKNFIKLDNFLILHILRTKKLKNMIVPKITYELFFFNRNLIYIKIIIRYKYDILRTENMIFFFFHNHNFIQIHLLVSFKIKIKIIMIHSRLNVYKYMVLHNFHSPSMKEEQLRNKIKLYPISNHFILSY